MKKILKSFCVLAAAIGSMTLSSCVGYVTPDQTKPSYVALEVYNVIKSDWPGKIAIIMYSIIILFLTINMP